VARGLPFAVLSILLLPAISLAGGLTATGGGLTQWRKQLEIAQEEKDPDAIIELTRRIVAADPRDTGAWTALVEAQIKNEDYDRALGSLKAWEKIAKPRPAAIDRYRGDIYLAEELSDEAERAWRASLAIKPNDYIVLSKLADLLETEERWPEVLALRTRAAAAKPAAALLAAKAGALLHLHQWDAANAAIQKANNLDATDPTVQQWLPRLELLAQSLPRIKELDGQLAAKPKDPEPLLDQAAVFSEIGQPSLALSNAKRALGLAPGSVRARIQAGEAQLDLGHPDEAAKFKVGHDLPRGDDGHVTPQALRELQLRDEAVLKNPGKPGPLAARSKTLRGLNQYVLALDDARAALRLDPNSPDAEFEMGHDLDALRRPGEALPHIVHSTELRPDDPVAWYYRGIIEANRADFTAAVASQTRSLAIRESVVALQARLDCELRLSLASQADADAARLRQLQPSE
jgi:tetratricopeptide (TPR) repeat protein